VRNLEDAGGAVREVLVGREVVLGGSRGLAVTRTLPHRDRRMVGAWCFADYFAAADLADGPGMRVAPHPHTGLQTVTWLIEGEVHHRDSIGSSQLIRPGQLNLMTAGGGIAHSEESPAGHGPVLHGIQLWVALPEPDREMAPRFDHHADLPVLVAGALTATVLIGSLGGVTSPAPTYSPLVGAEVRLDGAGRLPLADSFEHAALAVDATVEVDGVPLAPGELIYLGSGRDELEFGGTGRLLLLGGEPFAEEIVMWWNFIGRGHADIVRDRSDWMADPAGSPRFGEVRGYDGAPLLAPSMPETTLKPRGRVR
jgi:redox-sensitive bicupin YhaK (pirin superfamily)